MRGLGGAGLLALLLAGSVPACGGVSTGTGPDGAVSSDQFAGQLTDAYCDNIGGCCQAAAIDFDLAACKANAGAWFRGQLSQIMSLKVRYVAGAAGECVAAYASVVKSCTSLDNSFAIDAACRPVLVGTLPVGAPCTESNECVRVAGSAVDCQGDMARTCVATPKLKLGDSCSDTCPAGFDCSDGAASAQDGAATPGFCYVDDGLYCDSSHTCQAPLAVGAACNSSDVCTTGAFCADGACTALPSCVDDSDCAGSKCQVRPDGSNGCGASGIATTTNCRGAIGAEAD